MLLRQIEYLRAVIENGNFYIAGEHSIHASKIQTGIIFYSTVFYTTNQSRMLQEVLSAQSQELPL